MSAMSNDSDPSGASFRERHALKVLGSIMVAMFALVIVAQVAC